MPELQTIGTIKSDFKQPADIEEMRKHESEIIIKPDFEKGLYKIEDNKYLQIIFYLHRSEGYNLIGPRRYGEERGVFVSRSPKRPAPIGVSTVELLKREGRKLKVKGLDAIEGTPVLDIKPYSDMIDKPGKSFNQEEKKNNPRIEIEHLIENNDIEKVLLKSGELHGHFCPGLALGVKAAVYALKELKLNSQGMEDVLAITETNSCFADGIQYVTGCTFGNNALIYRDYGKTAVTITDRKEKGIRLYANNNDYIKENYPEVNK